MDDDKALNAAYDLLEDLYLNNPNGEGAAIAGAAQWHIIHPEDREHWISTTTVDPKKYDVGVSA
jgi:hypothetical protein